MAEWQSMETAPRNGAILFSYWDDIPVFIAWMEMKDTIRTKREGIWPFRKTIETERLPNSGWRVLMPPSRNLGWGIHGNFGPFDPPAWQPLPPPPISGEG